MCCTICPCCLIQFSSVPQSCLTLCLPRDCSTPGLPVHHQLWTLLKLMFMVSVMPSNHLILCRPLLLPPLIFPNFRVFPNESILRIWWPKYWSFSFSISPSLAAYFIHSSLHPWSSILILSLSLLITLVCPLYLFLFCYIHLFYFLNSTYKW